MAHSRVLSNVLIRVACAFVYWVSGVPCVIQCVKLVEAHNTVCCTFHRTTSRNLDKFWNLIPTARDNNASLSFCASLPLYPRLREEIPGEWVANKIPTNRSTFFRNFSYSGDYVAELFLGVNLTQYVHGGLKTSKFEEIRNFVVFNCEQDRVSSFLLLSLQSAVHIRIRSIRH